MNIYNLLTQIEKADPEIYERLDSRRAVFKHFAGFGKKLAATAIPLAFGAMLNKAYGQTTTRSVTDVLKFAYLLENLEAEFYKQAAATDIFASAAGKGAFETIRNHEVAHVNFLKGALGADAPTYTADSFDFDAKGALGGMTFKDYPTMLAVAQAFEDTGVRAYKGQAAFLISNNDVLQAALQIHSVEARHAAHIRRMRRDFAAAPADQKPWITGKDRGGLPALVQAIYDGEEATTQAGVKITGTFGGISISDAAASEAFDETLSTEQIQAIVTPFLKN
ncbi:ferritin-like domain-containing protein [Adhaeribacter swui]|uniref:Ferritin-like domain-containing protein n=1 Tax=Adhaeribacter swui TaxID=2086471 RepID=A0A7G7GAS2_9BACT|nr:ferritin-like domain-containing protein [Adhaeribacter swui]QNF34256.1 ferritin-like domain-containing protein [Adhaeribacter swui]